jgi:hypothetical protein
MSETPAAKYAPSSPRRRGFFYEHSLGMASIGILLLWICLYIFSDPSTHLGSFFGNAIADWSGVVVTVWATKIFYEKGSKESRKPPKDCDEHWWGPIEKHSLSIFLVVTGACWVVLYIHANPNGKWGQVVGNIVSEWTQIFGMVLLTKRLIERHSKE